MRSTRPEPPLRRSIRRAAVAGAAVAAFITTSAALAAFTSTSSVGATYATKRIFAGVRSSWAWDIRDASAGGAETNSSDTLSYVDARTVTTKSWSSAFASTRFDDFDFSAGLPAGVPVTSATFSFTFAASRNADTVCFYLDVRRASTNALLGTHGSSGTPSGCVSGQTQTTTTVDVSAEVTTTDIANDLRIRVYGNNSTNRPIVIDRASMTITTPYATATLLRKRWDDEADGVAAATLWPLVSTDGTAYSTVGSFATTFSTTRYVKFTPNAAVATGSTITNAQLQLAYKSGTNGDQTCWYFEVYNGATLIGTHGSSTTPVSCNSTSSYVTDTVALPEISTAAIANAVVLKVYMKNSGARAASFDLVQLDLNYYLD
jgi:hypothetical protein